MGLRKQQNLLHWLNKKLSSFFSRFKPCAATTSWQEKVTRKFYWPDRSSCVFFFFEIHCHHRFNTGVAIFLRLALSRCVETIANWGSWPVKTMQSNRTQLQQWRHGKQFPVLVPITTVSTTASTETVKTAMAPLPTLFRFRIIHERPTSFTDLESPIFGLRRLPQTRNGGCGVQSKWCRIRLLVSASDRSIAFRFFFFCPPFAYPLHQTARSSRCEKESTGTTTRKTSSRKEGTPGAATRVKEEEGTSSAARQSPKCNE